MKNMGLVTIAAVAALSLIGCNGKKPKPPAEAAIAPNVRLDDMKVEEYSSFPEGGKYKGPSEGKGYYRKSVKQDSFRKSSSNKGKNVKMQSTTMHGEHKEDLESSESDQS